YHNRAHSDFQLMRGIARHRRVLVVNSIGLRMPLPGRSTHVTRRILRKLRSVAKLVRRPLPDLPQYYVMSPLPLPFYRTRWLRTLGAVLVRAQVRAVCLALGMRAPVIVTTLPTAWDAIRPMQRHSLVFNRSDRHSEFPESDRATIEHLEHDLLRGADHVLYVSRSLLASERALTGRRAHFLDHGVDIEHFRRRETAELPVDLAAIPEPRVGFFGALDDFLVDFDLLERVAAELPDVSLVLIGDATHPMDRFEKYPNVHWLGFRPYEQIPAYGSGFAVGIMPWLDNPWIAHANPVKLKEYLALGLPVVSTPFAEIAYYTDRVWVAATPAEFVAAIRSTLTDGGLGTPRTRRGSVLNASWTARSEELIKLVEGQPRDPEQVHP
ncbi:MAG: glycosyltransferase, partial [Pseudonocardiaceae bacterium]